MINHFTEGDGRISSKPKIEKTIFEKIDTSDYTIGNPCVLLNVNLIKVYLC